MIFKDDDAPRYVLGFVVIVTSFIAGITVLIYRLVCVFENRKRDQSGTVEGYENAYQDDLTDRTVSARANLLICSLQTVDSDQNP